jgi:hypothetical protein
MSDPAPLPYGRDASGRFTCGNSAGKGRPHAFARQAARLRRAFFEEVTEADMRALVRTLITEATGGNLQAARLVMLWILGKPHEPLHPDGIEAMVAAEAQFACSEHGNEEHTREQRVPTDRQAHMRLAARELAQEMRVMRGELPDPGAVVETALEDLEHPC